MRAQNGAASGKASAKSSCGSIEASHGRRDGGTAGGGERADRRGPGDRTSVASAARVRASGASSGCARSACPVSRRTRPVQAAAATRTSRTRVCSSSRPIAASAAASSGRPCRACMPTKWAIRRSPPVVLQPTRGRPGPPSGTPTAWPFSATMTNPSSRPTSVTTRPSRTAAPTARSRPGSVGGTRPSDCAITSDPATGSDLVPPRRKRSATASVANQSTTIVAPMTENRAASKAVSALKWLRTPRAACPTMIAISTAEAATITQPVRCRARSRSWPSSHASVPA